MPGSFDLGLGGPWLGAHFSARTPSTWRRKANNGARSAVNKSGALGGGGDPVHGLLQCGKAACQLRLGNAQHLMSTKKSADFSYESCATDERCRSDAQPLFGGILSALRARSVLLLF